MRACEAYRVSGNREFFVVYLQVSKSKKLRSHARVSESQPVPSLDPADSQHSTATCGGPLTSLLLRVPRAATHSAPLDPSRDDHSPDTLLHLNLSSLSMRVVAHLPKVCHLRLHHPARKGQRVSYSPPRIGALGRKSSPRAPRAPNISACAVVRVACVKVYVCVCVSAYVCVRACAKRIEVVACVRAPVP